MNFSKLKFRTRLLIAFGVVFLMFLFSIYVSIQRINSTKKTLVDLYNYALTVNKSVNNVYGNIIKVHHLIEKIVTEERNENLTKEIIQMKLLDEKNHQNFKIILFHFSGDKNLVDKTYKTYVKWEVVRTNIIQLKKNRQTKEAAQLLNSKCSVLTMELFDTLKVLSDFSKKWADDRYMTNINEVEQNKHELLLILFIIFVVSISLVSIIANSIASPIKKLVKKIQKTHHFKKLEGEKSYKSEQELLELAVNELDTMSVQLKDFNEKLKNKVEEKTTDLKNSEERFRLAVSASNLGIWDWNITANTIYFSDVWKSQIGYNDNELENTFSNFRRHVHPDHLIRVLKELQEYLKNPNGQFVTDFKFRTKNGNYIWIQSTAEALLNSDGKAVRLFGMHRDITVRKNYEEKIETQNLTLQIAKEKAEESDHLKTEFLQNMSHEIRTPMNAILGFSGLLNNSDLSFEKRSEFIKIIQNCSRQLLHIIDDILEISMLDTKQVQVKNEPVCLNEFLFELFSIFNIKATKNNTPLHLNNTLSNTESTILTDKTKLNKVLSNLLENALKFTQQGTIELGYKLTPEKLLQIYVKDTGIGINPDKHYLIFERFSQGEKELSKKFGGLGLGLSIAKQNTELLGGTIKVISEESKGAEFVIALPYNPAKENTETFIESKEVRKNMKKCKLLIAEDEEVNFIFLEVLLKDQLKLNCELIYAKNGQEAVEYCKANGNLKMVLMDIKMPIMDGYEATKKIKELYPKLPIIAQTAYSTREDKEKAFAAGCDDFVSKPINKELLGNIIKMYIN